MPAIRPAQKYMELLEYYKNLKLLLENVSLMFTLEESPVAEPSAELCEMLTPTLSYLLASKKTIHPRIDSLYRNTVQRMDEDKVLEKLEIYDLPELENTLSLECRIRYKQMLVCCLADPVHINEQLVKLLGKAYPDNVLKEESPAVMWTMITAGAYDAKHASITFLAMVLEGKKVPHLRDGDAADISMRNFRKIAMENMPMPYWLTPQSDEYPELKNTERNIGKLTTSVCRFQGEEENQKSAAIMQKMVKEDECRKPQKYCAVKATPFETDLFTAGDGIMNLGGLPPRAVQSIKVILKDKNIVSRAEKLDSSYKAYVAEFLLACLKRGSVSLEELYDTEISRESAEKIADAYRETIGGDWIPADCFLSGALITALMNRIDNEMQTNAILFEKAFGKTAPDTDDIMPEPMLQNDDCLVEELQKEITALKTKNSNLAAKITAVKEEKAKEIDKLRKENTKLKRDYESKTEEVEDILAMLSDDEENETVSISDMQKAISQKKLLFIGGHDTWQNAMKKVFPRAKFIQKGAYSTVSKELFNGLDCAVYQVKMGEHSMYRKCKSMMHSETQLIMLNSNNTETTIRKIYHALFMQRRKAG